MGKPPEEQRALAGTPVSPLERQLPNVELEELIRQQGVKPFDPDEFDKLWPPEFDPDAFLDWYRQYKAEQRALPVKDKFNL